uniref:Putative nonsense-mediated mrna decay protein n=1 Tax=Panstrongylus megistus TaxID=65343 RepID=A0A069DXN4_9HEMI
MKKNSNSIPDSRSDSAELPIRLYRAISDVVRHLDDQRARTERVFDLFSESIETQRIKLRDYSERLMFTDPVGYGRKTEELLWRKGFYEIVATVKRLMKNVKMEPSETFLVQCHLQSGIGFYHHIIMKLQSYYRLDLRGIVDFPLFVTDRGLKKDKAWWTSKPIESSALEWANQALHRCLIYLGDLNRYLSDLQSSYDHNFAQRYYAQALNWKPECGMPHNQLGTLAGNQNYGLDAAYYYMRCLCCAQKFEGAEGNLQHLLENNAHCLEELRNAHNQEALTTVKRLIITFIHLAYCMFYDKNYAQVNQLGGEVFTYLGTFIIEKDKTIITLVDKSPCAEPTVLNDDMLFKMIIIIIMCVQQLKLKASSHAMGGVAICLSLMSQLVQYAVNRLEVVLKPRVAPSADRDIKQRRRRKRRGTFSNASDLSEDENDSVYSLDSDISEEDLIFDQCHDSDEEPLTNGLNTDHCVNGFNGTNDMYMLSKPRDCSDPSQPWNHPIIANDKAFQHIHKICQEGYIFQSIKICCDWIDSNPIFLKCCGATSVTLVERFVGFLNHLTVVPSLATLKDHFDEEIITENILCTTPLPEDVALRGLSSLQLTQSKLNWDYLRIKTLKPYEETYSRICYLIKFGINLAQSKASALAYDDSKRWFTAESQVQQKNGLINSIAHSDNNKAGGRVEKLMHDMGELWLRSEVSQLEDKTRKGMKDSLPPYLVPDPDAFLNHPSLIKQLISAKKFIVLIPSVVVSALDECKQSSSRVRDTIRWLEWQLRNGRRNMRLQRANEHQAIPFIKYPKKKDKEAWMFLQVVECCNYLCNQSTGEKNPELVTLLTGSKTLLSNQNGTGFSHLGVAKSAGINVEHIETFFSKWKSSSKSHG